MRASALFFGCLLPVAGCSCNQDQTGAKRPTKAAPQAAVAPAHVPASIALPEVQVPKGAAYVVFGGGSEPLSNQVSLAQDLTLVTSMLQGPGVTLFASGPGAQLAVQADAQPAPPDDVRAHLARLFGVPGAPETHYERAKFAIDGPSTSEHVLDALERAVTAGKEPLFVYAASHGERGPQPADAALALWGGWAIKVRDLSAVLDRSPEARPTRWVITACYGGGFADLAFKGADETLGVRGPEHCALFAAPWDDEASGCDPNPDRRVQESYSIHFLSALQGQDRAHRARLSHIDLDGDGLVSLLEAHTWARTQAKSFDVPTTTSERYLRHATRGSEQAELDPLAAPEEVAVVKALGEALELDDEKAARAQLLELDRILQDARALVDEAQRVADDSFYALRIALLERWPLLDHPWEARTQAVLLSQSGAILQLLDRSELAQANAEASRELSDALAQEDAVRVERARVLRLVRAFETLRLASALKKRGGAAHRHFQALRSCERWVPPVHRRPKS